jgi:hypothetical protein
VFFYLVVPVTVVYSTESLHAGAGGYAALLGSWGAGIAMARRSRAASDDARPARDDQSRPIEPPVSTTPTCRSRGLTARRVVMWL